MRLPKIFARVFLFYFFINSSLFAGELPDVDCSRLPLWGLSNKQDVEGRLPYVDGIHQPYMIQSAFVCGTIHSEHSWGEKLRCWVEDYPIVNGVRTRPDVELSVVFLGLSFGFSAISLSTNGPKFHHNKKMIDQLGNFYGGLAGLESVAGIEFGFATNFRGNATHLGGVLWMGGMLNLALARFRFTSDAPQLNRTLLDPSSVPESFNESSVLYFINQDKNKIAEIYRFDDGVGVNVFDTKQKLLYQTGKLRNRTTDGRIRFNGHTNKRQFEFGVDNTSAYFESSPNNGNAPKDFFRGAAENVHYILPN